ncbi:DEAD/DEAH box helicase [Myxococcota bacterium]
MRLTITNRLRIHCPPMDFAAELCDRLTLANSAHASAIKAGRYSGNLDPTIRYWCEAGADLIVPRGTIGLVRWLARQHNLQIEPTDRTWLCEPVDFDFRGELRPYQADALEAVTQWPSGVLQAPTGSGKTIVGLAAIARRRQPALVVCHTATLAEQWVERATQFLDVSGAEVGRIGGGRCEIGDRLTVAIINSLAKCVADVAPGIGHLVVDECHRVVAQRYAKTVGRFDCRYVLGLSATPYRRDGQSRAVSWLLGKIHKIDKAPLVEAGAILRADVEQRATDFRTSRNASDEYQAVLTELSQDPARNRQIAADVAADVRSGHGVCLVLSDRRAHCDALQAALARHGVESVVLTGQLSQGARDQALDQVVPTGPARVIIGTMQLVGEGWDFPRVATLYLATPIKFDGRVVQVIGRVLRPAPGKDRARIVDYVDRRVPVLRASARARRRTYDREAVS